MQLESKQKGSALVSALLLMSIVTLLAVGMITRQNLEIRRTQSIFQNERIQAQAAWAELWAVERIKNISREIATESDYVTLDQTWSEPLEKFQQEGLTIDIAIKDLQGLFNINNITIFSPATVQEEVLQEDTETVGAESTLQATISPLAEEQEAPPSTPAEFLTEDNPYAPAWMFVRILENSAGVESVEARYLTESILYWMLPKVVGADTQEQDDYYFNQPEPYQPAHQSLTSISELRLIHGMTNPLYENVEPYITVLPMNSQQMSAGTPTRININTTSDAILAAILNIEPSRADTILSLRPYTTEETLAEQLARLNIQQEGGGNAEAMIGISSEYFLARAVIYDNDRSLIQYSFIERKEDKIKVLRRVQGEL